jgi:short-subunit dehydrogenase
MIHDPSLIGLEKYEPANSIQYTNFDKVAFRIKAIYLYILSFINFIPDLISIIKGKIFGIKPKNIENQIALVTGGGNGLGKAIAIELAKRGCNIAIADLQFEAADAVAKEISKNYFVNAKAYKVDVSNYTAVQQLKDEIESSLGFVDILINNAGLMPFVSLREGTPNDIQKILEINLTSHFWTCRTFLNGMIKRKRGHIVAISSMAGIFGVPRACLYCASKYGVRGMMNSLYLELCADGHDDIVKLTGVYPCFMNTRKHITHIIETMGMFSMKLDPTECAKIIVKGMLRNKDHIVIPEDFDGLVKLIEWIPKEFWKYFMMNTTKYPSVKFLDNGL